MSRPITSTLRRAWAAAGRAPRPTAGAAINAAPAPRSLRRPISLCMACLPIACCCAGLVRPGEAGRTFLVEGLDALEMVLAGEAQAVHLILVFEPRLDRRRD